MPGSVRKMFETDRKDEELTNLRDDVAICNVHMAELFAKLGTGESGEAWEKLQGLSSRLSCSSAELDAAVRSGDTNLFRQAAEVIAAATRAVRGVIERAIGRERVWAQIHEIQRNKAVMAKAEWRRQVDLKTLLPADQAMSLVMAIVHSVKRNCRDVHAQEAIAYDIGTYLNTVRAQKRPSDAERGTVIDF